MIIHGNESNVTFVNMDNNEFHLFNLIIHGNFHYIRMARAWSWMKKKEKQAMTGNLGS